jgi:D-ribose pyranase
MRVCRFPMVRCASTWRDAWRSALADVLKAVLTEMQVERVMLARETLAREPGGGLPAWCAGQLAVVPETISHEELKRLSARAKAVIRTGECTPYANIILCAGVTF